MSSYIISCGLGNSQSAEPLRTRPEFRKATRNMLLSYASVMEAIAPLQEFILKNSFLDFGYVLGTSHGELDVTIDFLKNLAETNVARPILFQNSLHNSTAGFISLQLKIEGPTLTVSQHFLSGENALDMAMLLLEQSRCQYCLVTGVDGCIPRFLSGGTVSELNEGAATIVLSNDEGIKRMGLKPLAELMSIEYLSNSQIQKIDYKSLNFRKSYDSDAIEQLIQALVTASGECELPLLKQDHSGSLIRWRQVKN